VDEADAVADCLARLWEVRSEARRPQPKVNLPQGLLGEVGEFYEPGGGAPHPLAARSPSSAPIPILLTLRIPARCPSLPRYAQPSSPGTMPRDVTCPGARVPGRRRTRTASGSRR